MDFFIYSFCRIFNTPRDIRGRQTLGFLLSHISIQKRMKLLDCPYLCMVCELYRIACELQFVSRVSLFGEYYILPDLEIHSMKNDAKMKNFNVPLISCVRKNTYALIRLNENLILIDLLWNRELQILQIAVNLN